MIGHHELHVTKALTTIGLEDWRATKPEPEPCIEYTDDLEGAMLIPKATRENELDEILDKKKTLPMYLDICTDIDYI